MKKYILNMETQKIELHFEKSEYMSLNDVQKKDLKSAYLWSRSAGAWVSRSKNNHYRAIQIANKLGFTEEERQGKRLSYEEELERKSEKAETKAERYEQYATNAEKRAKNLQAALNSYHGDIAFFTQPIIAGHAGSRAFANYRERLYKRYEKGIDEYKKSEYYKERAAIAQSTADNTKLKDKIYLDNRIKECKSVLKKLQNNIISYEEKLYRIQNGETIINYWTKEPIKAETIEKAIADNLEKYEYQDDKLMFFNNCMEKLGGIQFSKDNIKPGYIVKIKRCGKCEIISTGPKNVTYKILEGGAAGCFLKVAYAGIIEVISEAEKKKPQIINPYKLNDILCSYSFGGKHILRAYQVVKTTATGVKLRQVKVENNKPLLNEFISNPMQKKITKSKFSNFVGVYMDNWQLHKLKGVY